MSSTYASEEFVEKIKKLVEKDYVFYAFKKTTIYYLNGNKRDQKVTFEEFLKPRNFTKNPTPHSPPKIARDMFFYNKKGFEIILRKKRKFYSFQNGKLIKFDPLSKTMNFRTKKQKKVTIEKTHCKYCTYKFSGNYITLDNVAQFNAEIAWLPYLRLTDTTGLRLSLGASPYTTENDELEEIISIGIKGQVLLRQYIMNIFVELGGGTHYFTEYQDFSSTATTGIGYTFSKKRWLVKNQVSYNSIFFHVSTVNWKQRINEAKFGIGFSF